MEYISGRLFPPPQQYRFSTYSCSNVHLSISDASFSPEDPSPTTTRNITTTGNQFIIYSETNNVPEKVTPENGTNNSTSFYTRIELQRKSSATSPNRLEKSNEAIGTISEGILKNYKLFFLPANQCCQG